MKIQITSYDNIARSIPTNDYLVLPTIDLMAETTDILPNPALNPPPAWDYYSLKFTMKIVFDNAQTLIKTNNYFEYGACWTWAAGAA